MTSAIPVEPRRDRSALDHVEEALGQLACRLRRRGDHIDAQCPAHDDRNPSLSVDWRDDPVKGGRVLLHCHVGCLPEDVLAALGLTASDLFDTPPARPAGGVRGHGKTQSRKRASAQPRKSADERTRKDADTHVRLGRVVAAYPYTDEQGTVLGRVLRFDPKTFRPQRWEPGGWRWGTPPAGFPLYRLPEVVAAVAAGRVVVVVEGEKDADALAAAGVAATTNAGGAAAGPGGGSKWRDEHTRVLAGARVVVVADRDGPDPKRTSNGYRGYRHAITVRDALTGAGATVTVVEAVEGKDAADHLAAGRTVDELLANVIRPEDRVPLDVLLAWQGAPAPAATPASGPGGGGAAAAVLGGPERFRRGGGSDGGAGDGEMVVRRDEYRVIGDSLVKLPATGRTRDPVEVLGCRARLLRRVSADLGDGERPTVSHVDLVAERDGQAVELVGVEWQDFVNGDWVAELPWPVGIKRTHGGKSDVVNAIEQTSGPVPIVPEYGTLGWRELLPGRWAFIHAGGAIAASGPVEGVRVTVPPQLAMYDLPAPSTDRGERAGAAALTLSLLDRLPPRIAAPLLGAVFRPLLGRTTTTVMLIGSPGTGKTSLASIALQHHAPEARYDYTPIGAGEDAATATAMEDWRYRAGNLVFLADDLAPDRGHDRAAVRANLLARSQFNQSGKGRGRREGGTRPSHPPRGLLMLTGEDGASSESAETRICYIRVPRGEVDVPTLAQLGADTLAEARAQTTADVLQHYAARMPMDDWVRETRARLVAELREPHAADPGVDARRAETAADLAVGIAALLDAAVTWGAVSEDLAGAYWRRAYGGLLEAKRHQAAATAGRSVPERAGELLRSAILAGRVHVADRDDGLCPDDDPEGMRRWGWWQPATAEPEFRANGTCGGWTDRGTLWLDPGAAFAAMQAQAFAEREPLNVTRRALGAAFADAGLATIEQASDGTRHEVRERILGVRRRVWELPVSWLYDLDENDPPTDTPAPAPTVPPLPHAASGRRTSPLAPEPPREGDVAPRSGTGLPPAPPAAAAAQGTTEPVPEPGEASRYDATSPRRRREPPSGTESHTDPSVGANTRAAQRRAGSYRAPLVVCTDEGGWFPDGTRVDLSPDLDGLADVLAWADTLALGTQHRRGRDDAGQVWVLPELAARLGLPEQRPKTSRGKAADTRTQLVEALEAAGWHLGKHGLADWTNVYRPGGRSMQLVLPGWFESRGAGNYERCPLWDPGLPAPRLAARLGKCVEAVGMPYVITPAVTGLALLRATRAGAPIEVTEPHEPPPPARRGNTELDYEWQRPPTRDELDHEWVHAYDLNGQYLAAASSVRLGLGAAEHVQAPTFDPALPGYWLVVPGDRPDRLLPDLFDPPARADRGRRWVTTPTLAIALELGYDLAPAEAWVWPRPGSDDGKPGARYLEPWYRVLRDARTRLTDLAGVGDPDAAAVLAVVKRMYAAAVGRLAAADTKDSPLYRPDWRHHIVATARANLTRKLATVAARTGRRPVAVWRDAVLYTADTPDPAAACPDGLRLGAGLGQVKPAGTARLADLHELLAAGPHARRELQDAIQAGGAGS